MTSGSERKRRRAHERVKTLYRMEEGANDRRIVQLVYDYRLLSQRQLERLLRRSKPTVQRLLRRLYDHRYVERVFLPLATFGSSPALYVLDKQGIDLLRRMGVEDFTGVPDKTVSPMYIEHTLAINEFRIAVAQACEAHGWQLTRWLTENELKADYDRVRIRARKTRTALIPDSFFTLVVPEKGTTHFFLELDRGSEELKRFRDKVEAYVAYYKSGMYAQRYGAQGFRVLTVVDGVGEGRLKNLVDDTARVAGIGRRFWFAHLADATSGTVLTEPIWSVAGSEEKESLV